MSRARWLMACGAVLVIVGAVTVRGPVKAQRGATEAEADKTPAPSDAETKIRAALDKPSKFIFMQRSLTDFAQMIADTYGINVRLDQVALNDYGIGADTLVELNIKNVSLRSALAMVLEPHELTWTIKHETLLITTLEQADYNLATRVYDVRDLVWRDIDASNLPLIYSKLTPTDEFSELRDVLMYSIDPDTWEDMGGPGSVNGLRLGRRYALVINHTEVMHEKVARLLDQLRQIPDPAAKEKADLENADAKQPDNVAGEHYVQVYPIVRTARAPTDQLEELVRVSVGQDKWNEDNDTFVRGVAETIVVRHNHAVHKQVYSVLVGVGAIEPVYDPYFSPFIHRHVIPVVGDRGEAAPR